MNDNYKHLEITNEIIKGFYQVYNTLGYGFLEKVYENAMLIELQEMGVEVAQQVPINVYYEEEKAGHYFADFLIDELV